MPNPDINDWRNIKRNLKGQQRLSAHADDLANTIGHAPHDWHAGVGSSPTDLPVDDPLQAQRDAELVAVEPLADDETRADLRARITSLPGTDDVDPSNQSPELP